VNGEWQLSNAYTLPGAHTLQVERALPDVLTYEERDCFIIVVLCNSVIFFDTLNDELERNRHLLFACAAQIRRIAPCLYRLPPHPAHGLVHARAKVGQ